MKRLGPRIKNFFLTKSFVVILILVFISPLTPYAKTGGHSSHSGGNHHSSSSVHRISRKPKSEKTVHVRGYTRKNGTYVAPHDRRAPNPNSSPSVVPTPARRRNGTSPQSTARPAHSKCTACARDSHGKIKRSPKAKNAFKKSHPCPSTGKTSGACPGYVIDHVKALKRGGADDPSNMQWQTIEDAKRKDKTE